MSKRRQTLRALVSERMTAAAEEILTALKLRGTGSEPRLKLEIPTTPQSKEELEEQRLRALVTERLTAAAEEICELVERTIAEYEEELCRSKEENLRRRQLLEENQRRQQLLEENRRRQQLLEENQRRQQLLEENQRRRHHRGAENPPEAARPVVKQETCDDLQIHEVEVKEEDPEEPPVTLPRESHMEENVYETSTDTSDVKEEEVQDWTVPLRDDSADDAAAQREFSVFPKNKTLICSFCKVKFARPCQLKKHMVIHGCSFCQKICPSEKNLKLHMMLHTGEQPFQCPACDKRFRSRGFLNNHVKMKHSPVRPFSCSVCGAAFMSNHLLRQHMYQHTGRRAFGCSLCQETFKRKYELENHLSKHSSPTTKLKLTGDVKEEVRAGEPRVQTQFTHD